MKEIRELDLQKNKKEKTDENNKKKWTSIKKIWSNKIKVI